MFYYEIKHSSVLLKSIKNWFNTVRVALIVCFIDHEIYLEKYVYNVYT